MYGMVSFSIILFGTVFMYQISGENQRALMKGYKLSFIFLHGCGGPVSTPRLYSTYGFTADTVHNDSTLQALQQKLGTIGKSHDNLLGVDVTFANRTPFDYYLKTLAICHEYPAKRLMFSENHIYATGMSRYEQREDSISSAENKDLVIPELDISYP